VQSGIFIQPTLTTRRGLEPHLCVFSSKKILVVVFLPRGGLPPGAEAGYVYDWIRQWQKERGRKQKTKEKAEKESQETNQEEEKGNT